MDKNHKNLNNKMRTSSIISQIKCSSDVNVDEAKATTVMRPRPVSGPRGQGRDEHLTL